MVQKLNRMIFSSLLDFATFNDLAQAA